MHTTDTQATGNDDTSADTGGRRRSLETMATGIGLVTMITMTLITDAVAGGGSAPGPDATTDEIVAHIRDHRVGLQLDLAGRFVILVLLILPIAIGLSRHVRGELDRRTLPSRMVPYLAVWLMAVGGIANTLLGMLLFEGDRLLDDPGEARMLVLAMSGLFLLTMLPHGAIIGTVSEAGRRTGALPLWLSGLGYLVFVACFVAVITMPHSLGFVDGSFPGVATGVAYIAIGPWYLVTGIVLIVKGRQGTRDAPE
jgi:hypothetical protein